MFPKVSKQIVSTFFYILSYQHDEWIDEVILGFLSIISSRKKPLVLFNFS